VTKKSGEKIAGEVRHHLQIYAVWIEMLYAWVQSSDNSVAFWTILSYAEGGKISVIPTGGGIIEPNRLIN
jgi:hypothetical protein